MSARPTPSPARRNAGLIRRRTPIIRDIGRWNSRHRGKNGLSEKLRPNVVFRKVECVLQRDGHVHRLHSSNPVRKESADFFHGCPAAIGIHGVTLSSECRMMCGPLIENSINAHHGWEMRVCLNAARPQRRFFRIERIVGHHRMGDPGKTKHVWYIFDEFLRAKVAANGLERFGFRVQFQRTQDGDDAACRFRQRGYFRQTASSIPDRSRCVFVRVQ